MLFGAASRPRPRGASIRRENEERRLKTTDVASVRSPEIRPVREYGPRRSVDGRGSCFFLCGPSPPPPGAPDPSKEREETTQNDRRGIDSDAARAARARRSVLASPTTYPGAQRLTLRLTIGASDLKTGYFFRYVGPRRRPFFFQQPTTLSYDYTYVSRTRRLESRYPARGSNKMSTRSTMTGFDCLRRRAAEAHTRATGLTD